MRIYLAAPFFTPQQLELVKNVEDALKIMRLEFYSPRTDGVLIDMSPEQKKASTRRIFNKNVLEMTQSNLMLAVIDGRDTGTVWEIGFAYASGIPVITYSDQGYGVNVMIKECVWAHAKGLARLAEVLKIVKDRSREALTSSMFENFMDFSEDVT